ncbi:unnamed protein product [Clonostachys solani]|uniref:Uncharacterized protein n=1 Tax=Clonostachys solani TaxID=160281 RepID=A0A9N9ZNZ2_9HYPO|nr:unnamed protein product [Clonostachys solani]
MVGHFRTTRKPLQEYQSPASRPSTELFENDTSFRARLRSPDDTPTRPPKKQRVERPNTFFNVYEHLGACFALEPSPPSTTATRLPAHRKEKATSPSDVGLAKQFSEAFTQAGVDLHASALENLAQARSQVMKKMSAFGDKVSKTLDQQHALYDSISWPLSSTLCSSGQIPKATIEKHLANLEQQIKVAEEKLEVLGQE